MVSKVLQLSDAAFNEQLVEAFMEWQRKRRGYEKIDAYNAMIALVNERANGSAKAKVKLMNCIEDMIVDLYYSE